MSSPKELPDYIWRTSRYDDLVGRGGLVAPGRWHTMPQNIVYCCLKASTAYAEILKQVGHPDDFPSSAILIKIAVKSSISFSAIDVESLPDSWADDKVGPSICRPIGDEWLRSIRTPLLIVPSAADPGEYNALLNPAHPDAKEFEVSEKISMPFPEDLINNE